MSGEETEEAAGPEKEKNVYTVMVFENIRVLAVDSVLSELSRPGKARATVHDARTRLRLWADSVLYEGDIRIIMRSPSVPDGLTTIKLEDHNGKVTFGAKYED